MKVMLALLTLLIGCATTSPTPNPSPVPVIIYDTTFINIPVTKYDTTYIFKDSIHWSIFQDTVLIKNYGEVSVTDFGAKWDGVTDDIVADSTACAFCISHPWMCSTVIVPTGAIAVHSRPLVLQNVINGANQFFSLTLKGGVTNKPYLLGYGSTIRYTGKSGFGIGIELARGVKIENITVVGQYGFPNSVTNKNIGTLLYSQWVDSTITDSRYAPYAGIVIDPYPLLQGGRGGSSVVEITGCSLHQWMVGIAIGCNGSTLNAERINMFDDDFGACRDAIAIGQDQSKEIHIDRPSAWASVHTFLDGINYGTGTGGGSVDIEGGNFAGNIGQLFYIHNDRFPLSAKDIYSESVFRIGTFGGAAGANIINPQIDLLTGTGMPAADYVISGRANFYGGMLRYYDGSTTHRLNLNSIGGYFRDMTLNNKPITIGLYGYGSNVYPVPFFDNVYGYYSGKMVTNITDSIIAVRNYVNQPIINIDRVNWVSTVYGFGMGAISQVGDYFLGAPNSTGRKFWDQALNPNSCNTMQIGRVTKISGDSLYLDDVGVNVSNGQGYDAYYLDRVKN